MATVVAMCELDALNASVARAASSNGKRADRGIGTNRPIAID
ncbi:MAG: hypothetical protein AAF550_14295 [Myxococcota bacterium]